MKIRVGFISNSSSSSFTCDFCGETVSGFNASISDCGMFQCVNEHTICEEHEIEITDDMKKTILLNYSVYNDKDEDGKQYNDEVRNKAKHLIDNDEDWEGYFEEVFEDWDYDSPSERCPICQFQAICEDEAVDYLLKKNNTTLKKVKEEIKNKFKNYPEFQEYLTKEIYYEN